MTVPQLSGVVGGRYEIAGPVASGGMGTVYRARDLVLHRTIALKVLHVATDPSFTERFRAEALNAARLSHPNIVQVYDFGEHEGVPFIAMELVEGETIRSLLQARGRLAPAEAARLAAQVADALEHAHRAGLIHRDIKPENVLIDAEGRARVADFGLARAFAEAGATQTGMVFGTAQYLSPEQVTGSETDHRSDIFALGIVLFEMVTGRVPFTGESPVVIAYRRVAEDVPDVRVFAPEVPPTLAAIIARSTARDLEARYPTAGYMAESLRSLAADLRDIPPAGGTVTEAIPIGGQPTVMIDRTPPDGPTPQAAPPRRVRRRTKVALVAALVALATLFAFTVGPLATAIVPEVVGLNESDARRAMEARGFGVDLETRHDPKVPERHVIAQAPEPGLRARTAQDVKLFISLGPLLISLPDVRKQQQEDAEAELKRAGFTDVETTARFHPSAKAGTVIGMTPDPGDLLESNAKISLTISKGPDLRTVPDVTGDPEDSAVRDLKAAGFRVRIARAQHDTVAAGVVISQDPRASRRAPVNSYVRIVVSSGPPLVTVPDLICMDRDDAEEAAEDAGLRIRFDRKKPRVVDQEPRPGAKVRKGSTVTAITGNGFGC